MSTESHAPASAVFPDLNPPSSRKDMDRPHSPSACFECRVLAGITIRSPARSKSLLPAMSMHQLARNHNADLVKWMPMIVNLRAAGISLLLGLQALAFKHHTICWLRPQNNRSLPSAYQHLDTSVFFFTHGVATRLNTNSFSIFRKSVSN